jgi:hypothetical protein
MLYETLNGPTAHHFASRHEKNPRPTTPLKDYGVHTIKPQLRPCRIQKQAIIAFINLSPLEVMISI